MSAVSVLGIGAVTPFAADWPTSFRALAEGRCAIGPVTRFDATGFPCTVAAPVSGWEDEEDRRRPMALAAAHEAWTQADVRVAGDRIGVFVGAESGRASFSTVIGLGKAGGGGRTFDPSAFGVAARAFADRIDAAVVSPAAVGSAIAGEFGAHGPVETFSLACASSSAAIVEAVRAIRAGECDVAIAGGVGVDVDPLMLAGFGRLSALSGKGVSRPFDVRRDGFVVGEGAAFVVLGRASLADPRAVRIVGASRTLDGHHLTMPDPAGMGAERAMRAALADCPVPIGAVQAHGTSTPQNDAVEAAALRRVLPELDGIPASSVKGAVGHWIAGAGAIGLLCAIEAARQGIVLPTVGLVEPDPRCRLRHVIGSALQADVPAALVNAFAFGGANASLVVAR